MTWSDVKKKWNGEFVTCVNWLFCVGEFDCQLTIRIEVKHLTAIIIRDVASKNGSTIGHALLVLWGICLRCADDHPVKHNWRELKSDLSFPQREVHFSFYDNDDNWTASALTSKNIMTSFKDSCVTATHDNLFRRIWI